MSEEYDYLFKSIVVGDGGVGKTALTLRFSKDFFTEDYKMTIGVDFHVKTITIDTNEGPIKAKLQLWDTGGQERFSSIRPMYYRGSLGAVLVFDLTNSSSFEHLPQWIEEVRANIQAEIPLLLVGNKSDLLDQRAVSLEEINHFTRDFNLYYMETSAKTGEGVGDCFHILACLMIGQGVPEQLIANATVYSPGEITLDVSSVHTPPNTMVQPFQGYEAPPVPEPNGLYESSLDSFSAPPVPEPQIDYNAPPVPEPHIEKKREKLPSIEPDIEPKVTVPEPTEFEFKTPDEILNERAKKIEVPSIMDKSKEEGYKPKAVPFSSNVPIPAPIPEEFKSFEKKSSMEPEKSITPFRVTKKEEPMRPRPATMSFESNAVPQGEDQTVLSNNLSDYMPEAVISKKERKKQEKEKKKKEKQKKLLEEKAKQDELLKQMTKSKKEKTKPSESSSLFQTLTQKMDQVPHSESGSFVPFISPAEKKHNKEESSSLRIIPNVADIESEPSSFTVIRKSPEQELNQESKPKDFLICDQCGATLSSDYAFCNKCGNKLS
jgi:small GTP-binding protein